jgi:hypothetical protein
MRRSELRQVIRECIDEVIDEGLVLKQYQEKLVVASDAETRQDQSKETFRNKDKLKVAGFRWDAGINSWTIDRNKFEVAKKILMQINKVEAFVEKAEDLPEFVVDVDNLSRRDELSQRIDGFITSLTSEVDAAKASDEVRKFLEFQTKLRTRSFHNTLLIYIQNPRATHVEGFRTWQDKFGRQVRKGAKAITILAPRQAAKKEDPKITGTSPTGNDDNDLDVSVEKNRTQMYFVAVSVFDIKDTDPIPGKEHLYAQEPKWYAEDTPNELADKIFKYTQQLATELGVKLTRDSSGRGEMGWASGDHINIASNIDGVNKAGTLIHEIAHELLHFKESSVFFIDDKNMTKQDKEIQAESVSYLVLKHYDLPAKHQATYLALWKGSRDAIHRNLAPIKKVTDFIVERLDKIAKEETQST